VTHWPAQKLGDLCKVARGGSPRPIKEYLTTASDGINWIKIGDASASNKYIYETKQKIKPEGLSRSRMVNPGDFILSNSMSFGRPYIMKISGCIHDGWVVLSQISTDVDQDFLYYYLGSPNAYEQFDRFAVGSVVRNLNTDSVRLVSIPLPPLGEQRRIVSILDEAFAAIATATANTEKNLANAREVFESQLQYVLERDTCDWCRRPLGDVCSNLDSKRIPITKSKRKTGNIPYYGASGIVDHVADYLFDEDLLLVSEDGANLLARTYPIAFSVSGKVWINNHAHVLRFEKMPHQKLVEFYLNSITLTPYVSGMAQPKLNQRALNSITIPWNDDVCLVEKIVDSLRESKKKTFVLGNSYQRKLALLAELKQSILQKAFSGELTGDGEAVAEILTEEVLA